MNRIKSDYFSKSRKFIIPILFNYGLVKLFGILAFTFLWISAKSQIDSTYSFFVAGHADGAHAGTNIGLHTPFLKKLAEKPDSSVMALFLTGDIVNQSTSASWNQVESELSGLGLNSYYVMGNHDNNSLGHAVFKEKHGGNYYSFVYKNELYVILNSTESDRSISSTQLKFLDEVFANTDANWERAFIFFHEIIWNSDIKYKLVRSNSRSRYASLVNISNFWNDVYPRCIALPEKKFYFIGGDVGGNPDAIAASYDRWGNVILLSSGMGEVTDENYLKVSVLPDTVTFELIALNDEVQMKPVIWYNVPEKPDSIIGSATVTPSQSNVIYKASPIDNATSYGWNLSSGIFGSSDSSEINLRFDDYFQSGKIAVKAINDGFGESEPVELEIISDNNTLISDTKIEREIEVVQDYKSIIISFNSDRSQIAHLKIYDLLGRIILKREFMVGTGFNSKIIDQNIDLKGLAVVQLLFGNQHFTKKIMLH